MCSYVYYPLKESGLLRTNFVYNKLGTSEGLVPHCKIYSHDTRLHHILQAIIDQEHKLDVLCYYKVS